MKEHGNFISYLLLCVAVLMLGVSGVFTTISLNQMEQKLNNVEEQNEIILREYDLKQRQINDLKVVIDTYASETDAKISELGGDVQELKIEKETNESNLLHEEQHTPIGVYELTAYEWTGNPCANGNYPSCDYTVACNSLPLGTRIYIEGYGEYVVEDTGGMAGNVIDIYMGDVSTCLQFGRQTAQVYIVE